MKNDDIAFIVIDKCKNIVPITKAQSRFLVYDIDKIIRNDTLKSLDREIHDFIKGVTE